MKRDDLPENRYSVPGLERGLAVLELFDRSHTTLGAPEVAKALRIPRTTVFRLMQTLEHLGYLERDERVYRLGTRVLRLGFEYLASLDLTDLAKPIVDRLRDATGFSAQLVIRDGCDVVVVLKSSPPSAFASSVTVGTRLPAHATILGRALLADLDEAALHALYPDGRLEAVNRKTPRTMAELQQLLTEDRARGYTISESFYEPGISAVACPVRDRSGKAIAAISVVVPKPNLDPAELRDRLVGAVTEAATRLSQRLDYRAAAIAA